MLLNQIDERLLEIYDKQRKNNEDKTGWSFVQELKKEANNHFFLFSFFIYRTFELVFEKKKELIALPHIIKELLRSPWHYEHFIPKKRGSASDEEIEIFPGIIFVKGITCNILERLNLEKTKTSFLYHLMIKEKEINEELYLSKEQIKKFSDVEGVIEVFLEEYDRKFKNKVRIVKIADSK